MFRLVGFFLFFLTSCSMNMFYYHPDKSDVEEHASALQFRVPYEKKKSVQALFFEKEYATASVFICHGNAGNLTGWQSVAEMFWEENFQAFIFDYPEFGESDGKAKHNQVIVASQKAFEFFDSLPQVQNTKKIIIGFSLGGNLALKIAHDNKSKIDALIVEGAFTNHRDIGIQTVPKWLRFAPYLVLGSKFRGEELIQNWDKPLLVVHSEDDEVIPFEMGKEIYENSPSTKKELWKIKGKHLQGFGLYAETYFDKINKLIKD